MKYITHTPKNKCVELKNHIDLTTKKIELNLAELDKLFQLSNDLTNHLITDLCKKKKSRGIR